VNNSAAYLNERGYDPRVSKLFWTSASPNRGRGEESVVRLLREGVAVDVLVELGLDVEWLAPAAHEGRVKLWGAAASPVNLRQWEQLETGDIGLLYTGNGRFGAWGEVRGTARSREVAEHIWGSSDQPWECLIFLDPLEGLDIPVEDLNRALGYGDVMPSGLEILDARAQSIVQHVGGSRVFVERLILDDLDDGTAQSPERERTVPAGGEVVTGTTAGVGKIRRVPLREVWAHEADAFTVWLESNLDALSEIVDLNLVNARRGQAAGVFSVDLAAEDEAGNPVVIETQLEKSNHDRLGKVITNVAAIEARAAIWIVSDPRPEHIRAAVWLNESSADFYLVKVEAIRIGDSAAAPLLTLITGPSEETRRVPRA
jgi:hypothetical protein